jgi:hypothetical protein
MTIATTTLASTEGRLLARMSALWAGFVLAVALCTVWGVGAGLRWGEFGADSGRAALVPAGVLILLGHLAASRDDRSGAAEFTGTLPAPPRRRALALLAFIPVAGAAGALIEGVELAVLRPSGRPDLWLLAVPVLIPMIGAVLGIAAGLWWPATPAGPLTLFAAAALLATLPVLGSNPDGLAWRLFPVVLETTPGGTGRHVAYLVAVLAALVGAALARHWRRWAPAVVVVGIITAVVAVRR